MKITSNTRSPWGRSVWYAANEFDEIMDELRVRAGAGTFESGRGVDVDTVLERGFGVVPDFVDLPEGLLGRTRFAADGRFEIEISRGLSEEADHDHVARRRLRSTLGHECAHGALHAHLYLADQETIPLFDEAPVTRMPPMLCRHESVDAAALGSHPRYDGQWWEVQANRGMAALLLPRRLFSSQVRALCAARGHASVEAGVRDGDGKGILGELADVFDVNPRMVLYRLQDLQHLPTVLGQERLEFEN